MGNKHKAKIHKDQRLSDYIYSITTAKFGKKHGNFYDKSHIFIKSHKII